MKSLAGSIALGGVLALVVGCGAKRLQPDAGGSSGGSIDIDGGPAGVGGAGAATGTGGAGAATGTGGAGAATGTGGAGGGLFTGRRSFVVTSTLTLGSSSSPAGAPTSHVFTMVVDGDTGTAILGANGQGFVSPIERAAGGFRVTELMSFGVPSNLRWFVSYTDLSFALDPTGLLSGSGSGQLTLNGGGGCNMNYMSAATMSLTGTPDTVAPVLTFAAAGDMTDPFSSFVVVSSEPLPGQTAHPVLRAAGGDTVVFAPSFTTPGTFITTFVKPSIVLRFGEQYSIDISGMSDFAGNAAVAPATGGLTFATAPLPPLVAADGFESATSATPTGAQVLSGPDDPIISGTRSLYVPPGTSFTSPETKTTLALRLAVSPGTTILRFSYRIVNPANTDYSSFVFGSVGSSIGSTALPSQIGGTTATIAGTQVMLGPLSSFGQALPTDATGEIVLERITPRDFCAGFGSHPTQGIIIDDLRIE